MPILVSKVNVIIYSLHRMRFRETAWELYGAYKTELLGYEELLREAIEIIKRCEELLGEDRDDFSNNLNFIITSN